MTHRTLRPGRVRWALALATVLLAAGCAPESEEPSPWPTLAPTGTPHEVEIPQLVWADGVEPSSELEDHPLVRAAREADLAYNVAWNTGDFASTFLMDRFLPTSIARMARSYSHQGDDPFVRVYTSGWQPLEIMKYVEGEGGDVRVCQLRTINPGWSKKADFPGGAYDRTQATTRIIRKKVVNGKLVDDTDDGAPSKPCDGSTVPIGFFDPEPELPPTPVTTPVHPPLFTNWDDFTSR